MKSPDRQTTKVPSKDQCVIPTTKGTDILKK